VAVLFPYFYYTNMTSNVNIGVRLEEFTAEAQRTQRIRGEDWRFEGIHSRGAENTENTRRRPEI